MILNHGEGRVITKKNKIKKKYRHSTQDTGSGHALTLKNRATVFHFCFIKEPIDLAPPSQNTGASRKALVQAMPSHPMFKLYVHVKFFILLSKTALSSPKKI
jgi:hypothetical protein